MMHVVVSRGLTQRKREREMGDGLTGKSERGRERECCETPSPNLAGN